MSIASVVSKKSTFLVILDWIGITLIFIFSFGDSSTNPRLWLDGKEFLLYAGYLLIFFTVFYIFDLYYPFKYFKKSNTLLDASFAVALGALIAAAAAYADRSFILPRLLFVGITSALIPIVFVNRLIYDWIFASHFLDQKTLILGSGALAAEIVEVINATPHSGIQMMGAVLERKEINKQNISGIPVIGTFDDIVSLIDWYGIRLVVLCLNTTFESSEGRLVSQLFEKQVTVTSSVHLFERLTGRVPYEFYSNHYVIGIMAQIRSRPYLKLKRILDIAISFLLLIVMLPALLLAIFVLAFEGPKNIFFIQDRVGKDGKLFSLIKLRSMKINSKGKPTVTWFGKFIRKYRIDEIPQIINVFKGDMSLIGPRPEMPQFVHKCRNNIPVYDVIHTVKPGLTGWAQVNFRYTKTIRDYQKKFKYNLYYLKNISFALDVMIFLRTIRIVLLGMGQ